MRGLLAVSLVLLVGCGRKATRDDCELIVDRNVEVQLKGQGTLDPAVIKQRKDDMRVAEKDKIDACVGKRVTAGMIDCVKTSETAEQIDKCFR